MYHLLFLFFLHCPLSGPVLTSISLLIIPCMIVYVTNKQEPWTLNLPPSRKAPHNICLGGLGVGTLEAAQNSPPWDSRPPERYPWRVRQTDIAPPPPPHPHRILGLEAEGTTALSGLDLGTGALSGLNSGTGAPSGLGSESEVHSGPDMRPTALLGLNVESGTLSGLDSGTASIEATREASGLGMASVAMTREAACFWRTSMDKTDWLELIMWTRQDLWTRLQGTWHDSGQVLGPSLDSGLGL